MVALASCQVGPSVLARHSSSPTPSSSTFATEPATPSPSPSPSATPAPRHVFLIVLENASASAALSQPYVSSLASQYGLATNYYDVGHPSLPNYLAMTSGSTWGIRDDGYHRLPAGGLGDQLTSAGVSWKGYFEGFTGNCFASPYPYALKHNPFAYYGGQCPGNIVPMTALSSDLAGTTPQFSWIKAGLCNDGHDCGVRTAVGWLSQVVPQITASPAWQQNGVLFITWDESTGGNDQIALLVVSPKLHQQQFSTQMTHYSLLATIEDLLGVPRLGAASGAPSLASSL